VAQQITIDIVAETRKLTEGVNDATKSLDGIQGKLNGVAKAAIAAGSAFVLREGVQFLKGAADEARDAELTARAAAIAFGEGSVALQKITQDADKFAKELAVDNDELIKLATQLGTFLPKDAQSLSVELVALGKDVAALTGIDAEAWVKKFAKGMADGELKASDLEKMVPKLNKAVYAQAEAMFKAGKAQDALNLLIKEGNKAFGGAAKSQITGAQKLDKAMGDLKETIGTKLLPTIEKLTNLLVKVVESFTSLPGPVQNLILGLTALVGIGGPLLAFLASAKASLITLGIVSGEATIATGLLTAAQGALRIALLALPWVALIAAIVLVIQNWDKITEVVDKVWLSIKGFVKDSIDAVEDFVNGLKDKLSSVLNWIKTNWTTVIAIMTGPIGILTKLIYDNWDDIKARTEQIFNALKNYFSNIWSNIKDIFQNVIRNILNSIYDDFETAYDAVVDLTQTLLNFLGAAWKQISEVIVTTAKGIGTAIVNSWNTLKGLTEQVFNAIKSSASNLWGDIRDFIVGVVNRIADNFKNLYTDMIAVGRDIARGIISGLFSQQSWFTFNFKQWIDQSILGFIRSYMKIGSPSKVMAKIGEQLTQGLYVGMGSAGSPGINIPQINVGGSGVAPVNITINAGVGTDPYALGREVTSALTRYGNVSRLKPAL
jgi:hypothetical protein